MSPARTAFELGGQRIAPGAAATVRLPVASLYTGMAVDLPVRVIHGKAPGPVVFVSAALHGDEIIGVEIIRRLLQWPALKRLRGTLLAVPVVNTLAFLQHSRYLPDRRDLNRSFPGSARGSLAARVAHRFLRDIVDRADYGIDLHTGAQHRPNLPQIRANLDHAESLRLAQAFGAPLLLDSEPTPGTLREYTTRKGIPVLLYESSEALRYDEAAIRIGVRGLKRVLTALAMVGKGEPLAPLPPPVLARRSSWVRAPEGGVLRGFVRLGARVEEGQVLGVVSDPLGEREVAVVAHQPGLVIGLTHLPLVHEGDALVHLAQPETEGRVRPARRGAQSLLK